MRALLAFWLVMLAIGPSVTRAAIINGTVIGEGARPVAGATVEVVHAGCETTTQRDGTFSLPCAASGRHVLRASFGDLQPWQIEDVELGPDRELQANFMLMPAPGAAARPADRGGFWTRRLPNPEITTWQGRPITLRVLAIVVAVASFVLGVLTMLSLGGRFGVRTRRLSAGEVGDLVLNQTMPTVGERVTPVATVGPRGASATISYDADDIAAALAAGSYGLVFVSLVVAPGLFALFSLGLAVAMLVGQEMYLFYGMLLVPAGFLLTPIVIGVQALARRKPRG